MFLNLSLSFWFFYKNIYLFKKFIDLMYDILIVKFNNATEKVDV